MSCRIAKVKYEQDDKLIILLGLSEYNSSPLDSLGFWLISVILVSIYRYETGQRIENHVASKRKSNLELTCSAVASLPSALSSAANVGLAPLLLNMAAK